MEQTIAEPFATPRQMAEVYQVSRPTMNLWLRQGRVPGAFQIGNQWRIDLAVWRAAVAGVAVND
jgi:predicted site-specific integrase-resolvase